VVYVAEAVFSMRRTNTIIQSTVLYHTSYQLPGSFVANIPIMSTLEYLDAEGTVSNFTLVPWKKLHSWLSQLNGDIHVSLACPPNGINRGKILEELEDRRKSDHSIFSNTMKVVGKDLGRGLDWRIHQNVQGLTHLEELLVYQPKDWRKQAREYLFRFKCDVGHEPNDISARQVKHITGQDIIMKGPIEVVLFHSELKRTARYEPLNFLLSYDALNPLPKLVNDMSEKEQLLLT